MSRIEIIVIAIVFAIIVSLSASNTVLLEVNKRLREDVSVKNQEILDWKKQTQVLVEERQDTDNYLAQIYEKENSAIESESPPTVDSCEEVYKFERGVIERWKKQQ